MLNDEQVMKLVAQGDIKQLSVLFDRYHMRLYNYFFKMNYNKALSEDLTQNVFEKVIKHRETFKNKNAFAPWVFRIARNVNVDNYRLNKIKISDGVEVSDIDQEEEVYCENTEEYAILHKALNMIKPEYKEILVLKRFKGMKYKEIGGMLDITENNVKIKVHRAIKSLREQYYKLEKLSV